MIIVFDLDDTLYDETTFVRSGYKAVAAYLSTQLKIDDEQIFRELWQELQIQRNHVFNRFLEKKGALRSQLVKRCLSIYRSHDPKIVLYPEARACLERFKDSPLYVVTDGNKIVQKRKFLALGLEKYIRRCMCTYAFGISHSKPSPYCFEKICQLEKVDPSQVMYVADNPAKDFVGIKPLGFKTVRVLKGAYSSMKVEPRFDADRIISDLSELN